MKKVEKDKQTVTNQGHSHRTLKFNDDKEYKQTQTNIGGEFRFSLWSMDIAGIHPKS